MWLTLTRVVFKSWSWIITWNISVGLTLTRVVFKFTFYKRTNKHKSRLTLTRVVFKFAYIYFAYEMAND